MIKLNFVLANNNAIVGQEGKILRVFHEFGNKTQLGVLADCEALNGFSGGPGGKALKTFTIFSSTSMIQPFKNGKTKTFCMQLSIIIISTVIFVFGKLCKMVMLN